MPDTRTPEDQKLAIHESAAPVLEEAVGGGFDANGDPKEGGLFDKDKAIPLHIIRPGIGRGRGRHLYEADMLEENAGKFAGWRMYVDHLSPEARKAAGGLPRSVRALGGRVLEASWDPDVPADPQRGHGPGAVVGRVRPVKFIREMIEDDPELIEASISAQATGVRQVTRDGQKVWLVEGIRDRGSVDWVTEAGAGGRVAPLLAEAYDDDEAIEEALLESMSDGELTEYLRVERPGVLAEAGTDDLEEAGKGGATACPECSKSMPKRVFESREKCPHCGAGLHGKPEEATSQGDDMPITPDALREALAEDPAPLVEALVSTEAFQNHVSGLVESKVTERLDAERELIRAEARADAQREIALTKFERYAHDRIAEAKLPSKFEEQLREQFALSEESGEPSDALNVFDDVDDKGEVTTSAQAKLREAVDKAIGKQRELLAEANPTRVRGQGPRPTAQEIEEGKAEGREPRKASLKDTAFGRRLEEAGIDPDEAYGNPLERASA